MEELLRTNDVVALGYMSGLLDQAGILNMVADNQVSAIEGSIGAFPRRLMVAGDALAAARALLADAGMGEYLPELPD
ncbi:DUF2007 domain-containing protein [Camelimonas lactis]|uniref:Putative signal transducing protein n=1 Tax=Camelimonas lactis TaxID=659006 RepID=A0A4R2GY35_9HYPH|nr:DUF2007 domain-containing protein [Camelimonas lactis]TCO16180.1 putative signal transducing protein [Camelimonas lactis]